MSVEEARKRARAADKRIEGLRNLRTGYGSVSSAAGFWLALRGEDLIEVYAEAVAEAATLRQALKAVLEVAYVADDGDPWYCENKGIDSARAFELARAALGSAAGSPD